MEVRSVLSPGAELSLRRSAKSPAAEIWTVTGIVGEGAECVCYSAVCASKSGRLKEHNPLNAAGAPVCSRSEDGTLCADPAAIGAHRARFLLAYELLEQAKKSEGGSVLNNFIPPYELLYGRDGSIYVWTPDDKQGMSFEQYLREVRRSPDTLPEHKLYNVLRALATLADCIRVLHRVGLLHLDIKPANFLVLYDGEFNINPSGISLFDLNSLYPVDSALPFPAGTKNYCAPELSAGRGENRSDIYSLGAVLLRAIVFSDDGSPMDFTAAEYEHLDAAVASSPLILASETNSNVFLRHTLARILKKCLAYRPSGRYSCCEELIADLEKACTLLLPGISAAKLDRGMRLALLDSEPQENRNCTAVMQTLLFRCPIDRNLAPGETEIRAAVLGAGNYGQKFIDICLQAAQLPGKKLFLRAYSQSPVAEREVYLQLRPDLPKFVNCCGSLNGGESFADIDFYDEPVDFTSHASNDEAARELLRHFGRALPHIVFISLGDDSLNESAAAAVVSALSAAKSKCDVHYVLHSGTPASVSGASPVYVDEKLSASSIDPRLSKWAFNTHLCWMGTDSPNLTLAKKQFRRKYNLEASLAYALSIPAKLNLLGADCPENAADILAEKLRGDGCDELLGKLAALEHRRWLLEKLCSGWRFPRKKNGEADLLGCILRGDAKDERRRLHPCIVTSGADMTLRNFSTEMWDFPGPWDEGLDELDRISLAVHRLCLQRSAELREGAPLAELSLIRRHLAPFGEALLQPFERYRRCLQALLKGERSAAGRFDAAENALISALSGLDRPLRDELLQKLRALRRDFFPLIRSLERRDYKQSDLELILRLPFILSNDPDFSDSGSVWDEESAVPAADYIPSPVSTEDVVLPQHLMELTERIAENVHDVWAAERIREGWVYGEYRDSELMTSPDLVPYSELPESEKEYDRRTALETLKLMVKLGYSIERKDE